MYKGGMLFEDYERKAARTAPDLPAMGTPEWERAVMICVMGICGEAGEIADKVKKVFGHGHDIPGDDIVEEGGDLVWYLARLARLFRVTLEEMSRRNNIKLDVRYPDGFSSAASKARVDVAEKRTIEPGDDAMFTPAIESKVKQLLGLGNYADAIKYVRTVLNLAFLPARRYVDLVQTQMNQTPPAPSQTASFGCVFCERRECSGTCQTAQLAAERARLDPLGPSRGPAPGVYSPEQGGKSETAEALPASLRNRKCTNPGCPVCSGGILGQVCPNAPRIIRAEGGQTAQCRECGEIYPVRSRCGCKP